jgi:hypothetical protein
MPMTPRLRKFALLSHVAISLGWAGAVASFLALAVCGLASADARIVRAAYPAMELIGWFVIVPLCFAALATGLIQSLGTPWGLFRHYWTVVKLMLTLGATLLLMVHMKPIMRMSAVAADPAASPGDYAGLRVQLVGDAALALVVLLATATLGIYKPWGRTRYGLRRAGRPEREPSARPGRPWGLYAVLALIAVVIAAAVVHLAGGGHGRH